MKIVILAGGLGQRLWPLSRTNSPKHIKPIFGKFTLLQQTVKRLNKFFNVENLYIVTGRDYKNAILKQLPRFPKHNLIVEPSRKNTAAAIGLAAYKFALKNPSEIMVSVASDHFIEGSKEFALGIKKMERIIKTNPRAVCLMGVKPSYPETGYGYIETGKKTGQFKGSPVFEVKKFVEKPSLKTAAKLLESKRFFWNPSYFGWRVDNVQKLYSKFLPETHSLLQKTVAGDLKEFLKIRPAAIEYGILEKLRDNFFMIPANFVWADIGHWASVKEIQAKTGSANVTLGLNHLYDTKNCLVYNYSPGLLTTVGVENLLIIQTEDGTLVCHKNRAQDVKKLVEEMKRKKQLTKFI